MRSTRALLLIVVAILIFQNCDEDAVPTGAPATARLTASGGTVDVLTGTLNGAPFVRSDGAIQLFHQESVPHTSRTGAPLTEYQEGVSFFPIWSYGNKHPATAYVCHPDGASKKWREESPADPSRFSNLRLLKEAHFNTGQYFGTPEYSGVFLDEASRLGLQTLFYWYPLDSGLPGPPWETWSVYTDARDFISKNGSHPSVLGWIPTEETGRYFTAPAHSMEAWTDFYHAMMIQLRALSDRPTFILDNLWVANQTELPLTDGGVDAWTHFHQHDTVAALDNYITHLKTIDTFDQSNGLARAGQFVDRVYGGARPFWPMINVYEEYGADGQIINGSELPSPTQLRDMVYISLVHGATGLGYFGIDDYAFRRDSMLGMRPDTPPAYVKDPAADFGACDPAAFSMLEVPASKARESIVLWNEATVVNAEVESLAPVLLSKTSRRAYAVELSGKPVSEAPIRTMLKEQGGYFYLFAVNLDRAKLHARFTLPGLPTSVEVLFENRALRSPKNGRAIVDELGEFGVHVYRWPVTN